MAIFRSRNAGTQRPDAAIDSIRSTAAGRQQGEPQPAVGGEALLRGEVVDVELRRIHRQAAGCRGGVEGHQGAGIRAGHPRGGDRDTGGGLVVRRAVQVDAGLGGEHRRAARVGGDDGRGAQVRGGLRGLGELRAELAEGQELRAVVDQAERGDVPERGRAAVAQDHLVPVGQREQLREARAHPADLGLHRLLPVRGAQDRGRRPAQGVHLLDAHLGRAAAEAAVRGEQVGGDRDGGRVEGGAHRGVPSGRSVR